LLLKYYKKKPDSTLTCSFPDMKNESIEMRIYSKTACQLGIMWQNMNNFEPNTKITRAQFWTILSRLLYGNVHNSNETIDWYSKHLQALKKSNFIKNSNKPNSNESRWYIMLMLMKIIQQN